MASTEEETKPKPRAGAMRKRLLGLGFFVQGFRCFAWLAVNFFLKDGLSVDPSTLQLLQNSANLPMVAKPLYGVVSDAVYVRGQHRIPYIALGAFLQAISWLAISILSPSSLSVFIVTLYLLLSNLGASVVEVANDAIVAETGLLEVLFFFKILPFSILIAQLCPPGCEGSLMAFLMSTVALAFIVSGYLGVALASYVGVTGSDFSGLPRGILIQAACTLVPLYWSSCIPEVKPKTRRKED